MTSVREKLFEQEKKKQVIKELENNIFKFINHEYLNQSKSSFVFLQLIKDEIKEKYNITWRILTIVHNRDKIKLEGKINMAEK